MEETDSFVELISYEDLAGRRPGQPKRRRGGQVNQLQVEVEIMRAAGLEDEEIVRLAWLKKRVDVGECDDLTIEYKRLMFLRHLCESGRVTS